MFLMLVSAGGEEKACYNLTGHTSPHEWEEIKVELVATDPVLAEATVGCWYQVRAECGSGGGHELYVRDFVLHLTGEWYHIQLPDRPRSADCDACGSSALLHATG